MYKKESFNLRAVLNGDCRKSCNQEDRVSTTEGGICKNTFSVLDKEIIRCVGEWSYDKIYWLNSYFNIFAKGMNKKWFGLNYVEICSGPGRCIIRESGQEIDGTALAIVNNDFVSCVKKAIFIDIDDASVSALNKRIRSLKKEKIADAVIGDYNDIDRIVEILKLLPSKCLNLVFIDPTDCSISFALLNAISNILSNVDIIINVVIGTDINRNIKQTILDHRFGKAKRKYIRFLGSSEYFKKPEVIRAAQIEDHAKMKSLFMEEYKKSLAAIGYIHTGVEEVEHYYDLLFASKNKQGLKFWHEVQKLEPSGQRRFDF